ncbi:ScyD/ScyE family protein [Agromyces sp. ZXT2-3]|uniref:ScyD/ScyE family protein n=1 Tax=Agromyces sp. ZXT2-3 TaxID=3461152 RepID=UPI0040550694
MERNRAATIAATLALAFASALVPATANASPPGGAEPEVELLADGLTGPIGSTIGPDGALYVADRAGGEVVRIDTATGAVSPFTTGLPVTGPGGVFDVAFVGETAYALISVVGPEVGGTGVGGVYRIDGIDDVTLIADTAQWSIDNPPDADYFVPSGVQYAFVPYGDGFLVADGHHNRVLHVGTDGGISEVVQYGNVVPTGMQVVGSSVLIAETGPIPHDPATGRVVSLDPETTVTREIASGASLVVDVEAAACGFYALSQGDSPGDVEPGSPGLPDSGELLRIGGGGTFEVVVDGLDRPTSLSFDGDTAFIVTLDGEVLVIDDVAPDRHGMWGGCGPKGQG